MQFQCWIAALHAFQGWIASEAWSSGKEGLDSLMLPSDVATAKQLSCVPQLQNTNDPHFTRGAYDTEKQSPEVAICLCIKSQT